MALNMHLTFFFFLRMYVSVVTGFLFLLKLNYSFSFSLWVDYVIDDPFILLCISC